MLIRGGLQLRLQLRIRTRVMVGILVFSISDNTEVIFDFDNTLISENLFISDHLKKHKKPETEEEFGFYWEEELEWEEGSEA